MKFWLVRLMLVASVVALVASSTSAPSPDHYTKSALGPDARLSEASPRATFLVTVSASSFFELIPSATARVHGTLTQTSGASFVNLKLGQGAAVAGTPDLLASFDTSMGLTFEGNCRESDPSSPCEALLEVSFERTGEPDAGSLTNVRWDVDIEADLARDEGSSIGNSYPLPWDVKVIRLD